MTVKRCQRLLKLFYSIESQFEICPCKFHPSFYSAITKAISDGAFDDQTVAPKIRVIGHDVLLRGAGCCLWTRGFSGRRAWPWGRAAPWAARELRSARRLVVRPCRPRALWPAARPSDLSGAGPGPCGPSGALHAGGGGGFAALEAGCRRVAGVSWF